jgi:hypothetical protein
MEYLGKRRRVFAEKAVLEKAVLFLRKGSSFPLKELKDIFSV